MKFNISFNTGTAWTKDEVQRTPAKREKTEAEEPKTPRKPRGGKKETTKSGDGAEGGKRQRRTLSKALDRLDGDKEDSSDDAA